MRQALMGIALMFITPAMADRLPKMATPLGTADIIKIYNDKTQIDDKSDVYYGPDGKTKGVYGKPKVETVFSGTWRVADNEMCMDNVAKSDGKTYTDCTKFWSHGKKIYSLWTVHFDGSKIDDVDGYWTRELTKLKRGDLVSKRYEAAGSQ